MTRKRSKKSGRPGPRKKRKQPSRRRPLLYWGAVAGIWALIIGLMATGYYAFTLPDVSKLGADRRNPTITLVAANGSVLETRGDIFGQVLDYDDLPVHLINALIATEDRRFYRHHGVDPVGLVRALVANLKAGSIVQGGSTLTQQLAKTCSLPPNVRSAARFKN